MTKIDNSYMDRLSEIRPRCEAATPGPWVRTGTKAQLVDSRPEEKYGIRSIAVEIWSDIEANAEFIAHAREDIPNLLDRTERAEAKRDAAAANSAVRDCSACKHKKRLGSLTIGACNFCWRRRFYIKAYPFRPEACWDGWEYAEPPKGE